MKLFKRKDKEVEEKLYNPKSVYVLTTYITSDVDDGTGCGPRCILQYYLATKEDDKFYELFSKVEIKYPDDSIEGFLFSTFNTPVIEDVTSLVDYVVDPRKKLSTEDLFYFITMMNAGATVKELKCEATEDDKIE